MVLVPRMHRYDVVGELARLVVYNKSLISWCGGQVKEQEEK